MTAINQKEYLKKYLGFGKVPGEKKKKKKKAVGARLKIIDDDAEVSISQEIQDDLSAANEDAPQIVAIIDERPPSLRIDEQTKDNLWKPIGEVNDVSNETKTLKLSTSFKLNKHIKNNNTNIQGSSKLTYRGLKNEYGVNTDRIEIKTEIDSSPIRDRDNDISPPRIRRGSDYSPPRRSVKVDEGVPRRSSGDDSSPPRKHKKTNNNAQKYNDGGNPPPRKVDRGRDSSPLRKHKSESSSSSRKYDSDYSPPRRRERDHSPPRRKKREDNSPTITINRDTSLTNRRKGDNPSARRDNDHSPPRRIYREKDHSPPRKKNKVDASSPRMRPDDISPPRRRNNGNSPTKNKSKGRSSRWGDWSPEASHSHQEPGTSDKMKMTLDGKKVGLQNAKDLAEEMTLLKQREDEIFRNMPAELSGKNAAPVARAQQVEDPEEVARRLEKERIIKEKYDRWGKGVKQIEEQNEKIAEQLHEMSKPLARYADDEDLQKHLKEQEWDGDPMLAYIRKKKKKQAVAAGIPEKPMYAGEFLPNRFGIKPGYRWDGVDRSNGYEKKWFEVQNAKKATQEDAFKWSTEDM